MSPPLALMVKLLTVVQPAIKMPWLVPVVQEPPPPMPVIETAVPLPVDVIKPPAVILTPSLKKPLPFKPPAVPVTLTRPPAEVILGVVLPVPSALRYTP